jgi:hypothetical protein
MDLRRAAGHLVVGFLVWASVVVASGSGCGSGGGGSAGTGGSSGTGGASGSSGSTGSGGTNGSGGCGTTPADDDYAGCATCTWSSTANPDESMCTTSRSVNACCDWIQAPTATLTRAEGLHYYSTSTGTTPDYSCLTTPPAKGTPQTGTLTGYVKIFSSQTDTAGVKVQVFNVDTTTGALGSQVGSAYVTSATDMSITNTWLNACTTTPCTFRQYTITGVPTETPLVIETSDAGGGTWSTLYDYNIYFSNSIVCPGTTPMTGQTVAPAGAPCIMSPNTWNYLATAVAPADIQTAAITVGLTADPSMGVLAGEVHDCGDIRIAGANVDTDQAHDGPLFYFGDNESDPLPDSTRQVGDEGTSALGLFGGLNIAPGVPIRVSSVGVLDGKVTLLGTNVVQVYSGPSVTAISLRGRRPYQTATSD